MCGEFKNSNTSFLKWMRETARRFTRIDRTSCSFCAGLHLTDWFFFWGHDLSIHVRRARSNFVWRPSPNVSLSLSLSLTQGFINMVKLSLVSDDEVIKLTKAKSMYFQTLCCLLDNEWVLTIKTLRGKTDYSGSKRHSNSENCLEAMVNKWSSNGEYSQDTLRCRFSRKSKH